MRRDDNPVIVIERLRCTDIADTADGQSEPHILCSINEWQEDMRFQQVRVGKQSIKQPVIDQKKISLGCAVLLVDVGESDLTKELYTALRSSLAEPVQWCSLLVRKFTEKNRMQ